MSDDEVSSLRREIRALSDKTDRQHASNQANAERDREAFRIALMSQQQTFAQAMSEQRNIFQESINKQFLLHVDLDKKVDRQTLMLEGCVGDGQPGSGRVGALESAMELMKKFRWQALALIGFLMWVGEVWAHHGK